MNGLGDPIPLGDEVSEGRCSEARDAPTFQCNTINHRPDRPSVTSYPSEITPTSNPNRITGIGLFR